MKLILEQDRLEGKPFSKDAFIVYGDNIQLDKYKSEFLNGWYICINFPFKVKQKYVCHKTFEVKKGKCQLRLVILSRTVLYHTKPLTSWFKVWDPE
jgi:hypothetical protein